MNAGSAAAFASTSTAPCGAIGTHTGTLHFRSTVASSSDCSARIVRHDELSAPFNVDGLTGRRTFSYVCAERETARKRIGIARWMIFMEEPLMSLTGRRARAVPGNPTTPISPATCLRRDLRPGWYQESRGE